MIKIQVDELKKDLEKLQGSIKDFEPYSQEFIRNTIESFEGFNSDFINEIKKTLENMTDTKAPELLKKVQGFHDKALGIVEEFEKTDIEIGENIKAHENK